MKQAEEGLVQAGVKYDEGSIEVELAAQHADAALEASEITSGAADLARMNWEAAHQNVLKFRR